MADEVVDPAGVSWHFDKRVPIAILIALAVQASGIIWFAANLSAQVSSNTHRIEALERLEERNQADRERLVRVEVTVQSIDARLARMEPGGR